MIGYKGFDGDIHNPSCDNQEFKEIVFDAISVTIDYCKRFGVENASPDRIWDFAYESSVNK